MVLLPGCSCCGPACSIASIQEALPSINVTYSTTGFSAGNPASASLLSTGVVVRQTGCARVDMMTGSVSGSFRDWSETKTLYPGIIPIELQNGYVSTDAPLGRAAPSVSLQFFCGSDSSHLGSGNYIWARAFISKPIYTLTQTFTNVHGSPQTHEIRALSGRGYATSEGQDYGFMPFSASGEWYHIFLYAFGDPAGDDQIRFPQRLVAFTAGTVPSALLSQGATNWINPGEAVATTQEGVFIPSNPVMDYTFAYLATLPSLVGEFSGGSPVFYSGVTTSTNVHSRFNVRVGNMPSIQAGSMSLPDDLNAWGRMPLFFRLITSSAIVDGREFNRARRLGIASCEQFGFGTSNKVSSEYTGETEATFPGTGLGGNNFSGPSVTASISIP